MASALAQTGHRLSWQTLSNQKLGPVTASADQLTARNAVRLHLCKAAKAALPSRRFAPEFSTCAAFAGIGRPKQQLSSFTRLRTCLEKTARPQALPRDRAPPVTELMQDIPIRYINATDQEDPEFEVVVFQKDENPANARYKDVAWKVIKAQSGAEFYYTVDLQVAAKYKSGGAILCQGPFLCELGDTWAIKQQSEGGTPLLKLKNKVNALDTVVIQNIKPATFTGRMYDVMLMKDESPLVRARKVGVNSQVIFQLKPTVYFGVVYGIQHGQTFESFQDSMYNTPFNLMEYAGTGLEVTLTYNNASGEYTFTGAPADL